MKYRCIIVDDDNDHIEILEQFIKKLPQLELVKTYTDPYLALAEIITQNEKFDFIFTDINMPGLNGIELSKQIRNKTNFLILVTAHSKYVVESYQIKASHYFLKPFSFVSFAVTINELVSRKIDAPFEIRTEHKIARNFFIKSISKALQTNKC